MCTRAFVVSILSAIALAGVAGCSSDDSSTPDASSDPVASLETAARNWSESFYGGDGSEAYEMFTEDCKNRLTANEFKALSDFNNDSPRTLTDVTVHVDGNNGLADLAYEDSSDNDTGMPWVLVDNQWLTSDCTMRP